HSSTLFPYTTLFRSILSLREHRLAELRSLIQQKLQKETSEMRKAQTELKFLTSADKQIFEDQIKRLEDEQMRSLPIDRPLCDTRDRKSTRLNSSHLV